MTNTASVRIPRWLTLAALALAALAAPRASAQNWVKMYRLTELRPESTGQSRAYAINNLGQVVGWVDADGKHHSAYWQNTERTDLHGVVHFQLLHPIFGVDYSEAYDISDAGQIVGTARRIVKCGDDILVTNAFILRPAVLTDLATPYPGDSLSNLGTLGTPCFAYDSAVIGISTYGTHLVGWADRVDGVIRAFLLAPRNGQFFVDADNDKVNDIMVDLGSLSSQADPVSSATAVNELGQVTGYAYTPSGYHAFLVTPVNGQWFIDANADGVNDLMADLGTLGGTNSWGRAINYSGVVVGESDLTTPDLQHYRQAFRAANGQMTTLGTLCSDPTRGYSACSGINDQGAIVGWAEVDNGDRHAFAYENGKLLDLNSQLYLLDDQGRVVAPQIVLTEARSINEDGLIVGWGVVRGSTTGDTRGFLLTPTLVDPAALAQQQTQQTETPAIDSLSDPVTRNDNYSSDPEFAPDDLRSGVASGVSTTQPTGSTPAARRTGLCGVGTLGMMPLMAAGLGWLRVRTERRRG